MCKLYCTVLKATNLPTLLTTKETFLGVVWQPGPGEVDFGFVTFYQKVITIVFLKRTRKRGERKRQIMIIISGCRAPNVDPPTRPIVLWPIVDDQSLETCGTGGFGCWITLTRSHVPCIHRYMPSFDISLQFSAD